MCQKRTFVGFVAFCAVVIPLLAMGFKSASPVPAAAVSLESINSDWVVILFTPVPSQSGTLEAELYDIDAHLLAKVTRQHQGRPLKISLFAQIDKSSPQNYYIRFRFDNQSEFQQRSLLFLGTVLDVTVLGQNEFVAGTCPIIRVLVQDRAAGAALPDAVVALELSGADNIIAKAVVKTDTKGQASVPLQLPDTAVDSAKLKITVTASSGETQTIEQPIRIRTSLKTLLTTDKPLYQPGQTIHIRALSLAQSTKKPLAQAPVTFEVEDAKGNKVFKAHRTTDDYGISHADFVLADELNKGTYRIRAVVAGAREEKTVTVERYVLPKFKVNITTDRSFYQPGETVKGDIQADYFFGKPVAAAKVKIQCAKFDLAYQDFQVIEGKTDDQGHYTFEVRLPDHFVGQPLEAGKASAKFEIQLTDTADHAETVTKNVTVTASPILIAAVPESGQLIPNLKNKIYIVATYADATPAACDIKWSAPELNKNGRITTDTAGFAQIEITPSPDQAIRLNLNGADKKGHTGQSAVTLEPQPRQDDQSILLRTDRSLYKVGDLMNLSVFSTRQSGTVYIDLIKDRQTCLTQTLELTDGQTEHQLTLDPSLAGTVQVNAWLIGQNGVIVRDRKLVLIDPADELNIKISSDNDTYLPGTDAKLTFSVTTANGRPAPAAIGVIAVDEAVFALQESQPGLEKIYFYLEKEIATPRYEIHGYDLDHCITPPPGIIRPMEDQSKHTRDTAAKVLLASAKGVGDYSLHRNTFTQDEKNWVFKQTLAQKLAPNYRDIQQALNLLSRRLGSDPSLRDSISLNWLVEHNLLAPAQAIDPWGNAMKIDVRWIKTRKQFRYSNLILYSAGIDGRWDTLDDIEFPMVWRPTKGRGMALDEGMMMNRAGRAAGMGGGMADLEFQAAPMAGEAMLLPMAAMAKSEEAPSSAAEPIRIRQYFPETLYFNPAVITDPAGKATLFIPLADSITTWRLSCLANSTAGLLGSTTAPLRVFQDFFVDIDFPVALTQNDEVHVPVAIYNYLKTNQTITLTVTKEDWFQLKTHHEKTVTLAPDEVRAVYFPIVAKKVGFRKFTVTARGSQKSDAIARSVEIAPDGKEHLITHSGRLDKDITHTIAIPDDAIDDASKIFIKIYPGVLSQIVEGLENMLRMPFGCFEQTSSVTYPNILVLDYMKTTGKITPELQMKAEGFINAGYQRLVSFEVPGGGFEWFGKAPAHRILTAFGLMEFYDMAKVHAVDPDIITRTQRWLADAQDNDGSWKPSQGGIREGAINKFTDDVLRNTAYITWALASTEYKGPELKKGIDYLCNHLDDMKDLYTRALVANALAAVAPKHKTTLDTLQTLHDMRTEDGDMTYWKLESETPTFGAGKSGDIELTALAIQAFIRCDRNLATVGKAITFLVKNKDAYGTWQSTQATIQALRAMLMAERQATAKTNATIELLCNGQSVKTITVDQKNADLLQMIDLKDHTQKGDNLVILKFKGQGALLYQLVGRYYLPYPNDQRPVGRDPMTITLDYDRTQLTTNDIITVTATVTNNRPAAANMVIVDLGLPPGFTLIPNQLEKRVEDQTIEKYSTTGRQIIVYLRRVDPDKPVTISYQLLAKYPLRAQTTKSTVYEYYNPDINAETQPIELIVEKK